MVTINTQGDIFFGNPKIRQNIIFFIIRRRRENQNKRRNVGCGRQVKTTVTNAPLQIFLVENHFTFIPLFHRHPTHRLLNPLIKAQLTERVLFRRVLLCRFTRCFYLIKPYRYPKRRICFFPYLWVSPIVVLLRTINHRIKGRVYLTPFQDILCLLVGFIANRMRVRSRRSNQKV